MQPSLTPHEDAMRRACASIPLVADPVSSAVARSANFALIEASKLMDQGHGSNAALNFAVSVALSVCDSVINNEVANQTTEAANVDEFLRRSILNGFAHGLLTRSTLVASASELTGAIEPGRA